MLLVYVWIFVYCGHYISHKAHLHKTTGIPTVSLDYV